MPRISCQASEIGFSQPSVTGGGPYFYGVAAVLAAVAREPSTGALRGFRLELPARTAQIRLAEDQTDTTELVNAVREAIAGRSDEQLVLRNTEPARKPFDELRAEDTANHQKVNA